MLNMPMSDEKIQVWKLPFDLEGLKINHEYMFKTEDDDAVINLKPLDKNKTHGEIVFRLPKELPNCKDDSRCAACIGKASIESIFKSVFIISASVDAEPELMKIKCDENALYADERVINKFKIGVKQTPTSEIIGFIVDTPFDEEDLKRFLSFSEKLKIHPEKETLDRCEEWFKRGIEEKNAVNKLIMYWIAFNGLYSIFNPNKDTKAINKLLNDYPKDVAIINEILKKHSGIIDLLCQKNLVSRNGKKNYSDNLKQSLQSTDNHRKMKSISLCLWQVRNSVFHGGNTPKRETIFIGRCASLLKDIFRSTMYSYVIDK
jgi:hypothetical protein